MGIAVDPRSPEPAPLHVLALHRRRCADVRVVRWEVNAGTTALHEPHRHRDRHPCQPNGRHSGCRPRFGPDGHLWMGTGDAAVGTNPQSRTSLGGKVLRVTTGGAGAPATRGAPFDARIFNYGHRNVQGIAFRADGTGRTRSSTGPSRDDEVNRLVRRATTGGTGARATTRRSR